jgi:4-methyl-5(b-hydroxyethyl)-thiazole monophosphate biosynthesis
MKRVLVPLAEGFEEIEAVTIIDVLRRAGVRVDVASLGDRRVTGSHGIALEADMTIDDARADDYDLLALPGGMPGTLHLREDPRVLRLVRGWRRGQPRGTVCAAPACSPGRRAGAPARDRASSAASPAGATLEDARWCATKDRHRQGRGTAMEFARLVDLLLGGAVGRSTLHVARL